MSATTRSGAEVAALHGEFGRVFLLCGGGAMAKHAHPELHVIVHQQGAPVHFTVCGTEVTLHSGQALLLDPWRPHGRQADDRCADAVLMSVVVDPAWIRDHCGAMPSRFNGMGSVAVDLDETTLAASVSLRHRIATWVDGDAAVRQSAHDFIGRILRTYAAGLAANPFNSPISVDHRVRKALERIQDSVTQAESIDLIAAECGMSRSHFHARFKHEVGASPYSVVESVRMSQAMRLLASTAISIADISHELGFSTPGHFVRFFGGRMAVSPGRYRRRLCSL